MKSNREWLDAKKEEYKGRKVSEFYYGEGGACGLVVFEDGKICTFVFRNEKNEEFDLHSKE